MKTFAKYILQNLLGFKAYLYVFALFVIVKIRWDKKERDFFHFLELIPDGGLVLDLGANIGVTSYHLSKKLPNSMIFSFEPLQLNMDTLKRIKNKFKLNNIKEFQVAVGQTNGTLKMIMPVINKVPMHGLSYVIQEESLGKNEGIKYTVPVVSLDKFDGLKNTTEKITAIKIDVENFEYFALKGGEKLLSKNKPIIYCELWDNENRKRCISFINNLAYSAFVLYKRELVPIEKAAIEKHNFFFIPNSITD